MCSVKSKIVVLAMIFMVFVLPAFAQKMAPTRIAAAADLKFALDEILATYKKQFPEDQIEVTYGSSGTFASQIEQGAPFDLFFSADIAFPKALATKGLAGSKVVPYAVGRIVLWSASLDASKMSLKDLTAPHITKLAIANPKHAPYGQRSEEALRKLGIWDQVRSKIVLGENIAQTAQYAMSGAVPVAIIALSLAMSPELGKTGSYALIPENLHKPLEQGYVITKRAEQNPVVKLAG